MRKLKRHPAHENHERWLVSYADFITLLFAFFVVMFASSQADKSKAAQMSESVKNAFEEGHFSASVAAILGGTVNDQGKGHAQMKGATDAEKCPSSKALFTDSDICFALDLSAWLEANITTKNANNNVMKSA